MAFSSCRVVSLSAEHGTLSLDPSAQDLKIGQRLELIPGYADLTTMLHRKPSDADTMLQRSLHAPPPVQVVTILPKMIHEEHTAMVLPWDPFYRNFVGESVPEHLEYPAPLRALPPRMFAKR